MVVITFLILSILILFLYFLNKIRITKISPSNLLKWMKWYVLFLILYYVLSSNQYYLGGLNQSLVEGIDLSLLIIISFGMIIYVQQYCIQKEREQKLKELAIAYALMENELRQKQADSVHKN